MARHDVFICHASDDKVLADAACHILESSGLRCWIAPRDVPAGSIWAGSIADGIDQARAMLVIVSHSSNASPHVLREVERAVSKGIAILPLRIETVCLSKSLEYLLSTQHWMDAITPPIEQHLQSMARSFHAMLGSTPEKASLATVVRRRKASRKLMILVALTIAISTAALVWRPWTTYVLVRPVAEPELAALLQLVHRLDSLKLTTVTGFDDEAMRREFLPPETLVDPVGRENYLIGVATNKAQLARSIERESRQLLAPIDGLAPDVRSVTLNVVAIEVLCREVQQQAEMLLDEAERFQRELENLRVHDSVSRSPVGLGASIDAGQARLACWREHLAVKISCLYLMLGDNNLRKLADDPIKRRTIEDRLAELRALEPKGLPESATFREVREDLDTRSRAQVHKYASLVSATDPIVEQLGKELSDIASEWDDFRVLDSDTPERVIKKAVIARNLRRIGDSLAVFDEYARRFPKIDPGAARFARVGKRFTQSPFAQRTRSSVYVYLVPPESVASGKLREGDVIFSAGGTITTTVDAFASFIRNHAGRTVIFTILRESHDNADFVEMQVSIDVPAAAALGIGLSWI